MSDETNIEDAMMHAGFASSLKPEASAPITKSGGPLGALGVLPREIRDDIYEYVLDFEPHLCSYLGGGKYAALIRDPRLANKAQSRAAILTVSKLIYEESYPVIFTSNSFDVTVESYRKTVHRIPWAEEGPSCLYVSMSTQNDLRTGNGNGNGITLSSGKDCDLPPRLKDKVALIRRWTCQLGCVLSSDKTMDWDRSPFPRDDLIIEFLRENVKQCCLTVRMIMLGDFVAADGDVDRRENPDAPGSGTDCLLTLRDLSKVVIKLMDWTDSENEVIHGLSPEFHSYITSTLILQAGTDVEPFKGYRYIFYEKESDDSDYGAYLDDSSDLDDERGDLEVEQLGSEDGSGEGRLTVGGSYNTDGSTELATGLGDPSHVEDHEHHFEAAMDDIESQANMVSNSVVTEPIDSSSEDEGYDADSQKWKWKWNNIFVRYPWRPGFPDEPSG